MSDLAAMQRFIRSYENLGARSRSALEVRIGNSEQPYKVQLLGVMNLRAPSLITAVSSPLRQRRNLVCHCRRPV